MQVIAEQDQLYWRLVYDLVVNHDYHIINLNENGEVWLEAIDQRKGKILRLLRYDIDWGNWLLQDIDRTNSKLLQLKKQLFRKKVDMFNIYVTTYPPVDDWEYKININKDESAEIFIIEAGNRDTILRNLFNTLNLPMSDVGGWADGNEHLPSIIQSIRHKENTRHEAERSLFNTSKKPFLTYSLVAINVVMFLLLELYGSSTDLLTLIKFGAKYNPAIIDGEWWRFITPMFLHIGFLHLLMNTMALYYLGVTVERIYGTWRFFLIYFIAGIIGVVASFAFNSSISAGASGAIFGCFGALLYFGVVHRSLFFRTMGMNVLVVLAINIGFGLLMPMIDNGAHIGGLIGGFLASAIVHLPKHKFLSRQLLAIIALVVLSGSIIGYGFTYSNHSDDPAVTGQIASQLIEEENYEEAYGLLINLVQNQVQKEIPVEVFFLLSYTEIKLGHIDLAIEHLEYVVRERNDFHEAYYNLALVYLSVGEKEKADQSVRKALELAPNEQQYQILAKELQTIE